jgi:ABC-type glycerol-3-phosphate transport system substrate-binding protein
MKPFHMIVLGGFLGLAFLTVFIFSTYSRIQKDAVGAVVIWGSLPSEAVEDALSALKELDQSYDDISYQHVPEDALLPKLVAAIASGDGPDLVFFPASSLIADGDKLISIPYASYSRRAFQDTFIEAGEIFLFPDGLKGVPITVDPLVMYWNRSLFSFAGIAEAPKYWDEVAELAGALSRSDERGTLVQSAAAIGTWGNVRHAKPIFVSIARQLGNRLVVPSEDGAFTSVFSDGSGGTSPATSALRFYTDFADPVKPAYSWNRSLPESREAFISGRSAMYFGRVSEIYEIRNANPNLNFDVASLPSVRDGSPYVESSVIGLSIPRGSQNVEGALQVALALSSPVPEKVLREKLGLPSILRTGNTGAADSPYTVIFRKAALASFAFPDPDPRASDSAFERMIEGVSSGQVSVSEAVSNAGSELQALLGE